MPYQFTASEINQLNAARLLCPSGDTTPTSSGNWVPLYSKLSEIIAQHIADGSVTGSDLQDIKNAKLWLDVAIGANGGTGMHSAFIRAYTNQQGKLRLGREFSESEMQLSSNGVALNLWNNINRVGDFFHKIPPINEIAKADAASIGVNLFQGKIANEDTAISANAAWSGTLGFNLLGGSAPYESWRLLTGGDAQTTSATLNTLDDVKNVLYAAISYKEAFKVGFIAGGVDFLLWLSKGIAWSLTGIWESGAIDAQVNIAKSSGDWIGLLSYVSARTPAVGKTVALIDDIGPNHFLDMLMGAAQAKPLIGTTTDANFEASARAFFSNYSPTQLQSLKTELLPTDVTSLTAKGKSDVNARGALMALSAISVEVSGTIASKLDLYDVATGTGHISDKWLEDRASMLAWLKVKFQMETSGAVSNAIDGPGSRYFDQASNTEVLIGTLPADRKQYLFGSNNVDNLSGQDLDDHLYGGEGGDKLSGAGGADYLEGDDGSDTIDAGAGNDTVLGGDGADDVKGGAGTDKLSGDSGDDTLDGGADADTLVGGKGNDRYTFSGAYGSDTIKDEDGQGSVVIDGLTMTGGKREEGKPYYEDKATSTYYYWAGSTLSIQRKGSQGNVTVQNWTNGQLGIRLLEDIPKPRRRVDPIVLDLDGDGIETVGLAAKVHFDHASDGFAELTGWVGADDGMLVRDLDGNGKITSGKELLGSETLLKNGTKAANGFLALLELDSDNNKSINDAEAATLKVWRDANQNGITDDGELLSLTDAGVRSIQTAYTESSITDGNGNIRSQLGSYVAVDGSTRSAVDVSLLGDPSDSIATDTSTVISADIAALPNIEGYGKLPSLQLAMAKDATLKALVSQFVQPGATDRATLVRDILWRWTGADTKAANSRGAYVKDARWVYVVEAFTGSPFTQVDGVTGGTANPGPVTAADFYAISKRVYELLYARLSTQTYLKNVQDTVVVTWDDANSTFATDISNTISILRAGIVANHASGFAVLSNFVRSLRTFGQFTTATQNSLQTALGDLGTDVTQAIQSPTITGFGLDVSSSTLGQTILGTAQSDTLIGTGGDDTLSGDAGNDNLIGGWGNDVLDGGLGADTLFGNEGADTYRFGRTSGQDTIDNFDQDALGTNADQISFSTGAKSQDVSLARSGDNLILNIIGTSDSLTVLNFYAFAERNFFFNGSSQIESVRFVDPASTDQVWTAEYIRGKTHVITQGNDRLTGVELADIVDMQGGDDTVYGLGGADSITGGSGADKLYGGSGQDTLDGGTGNDFLDGGAGDDTYWFGLGDGNDVLREGTGSGPSDSGGTDTLRIRSGISSSSVKISRDRTDIVLTLPGHTENQTYVTDSIRLQNVLDNDGANTYSIESVIFDNNETWSIGSIKDRLLAGGDTDDVVEGYITSDDLHGNGGNDTLIGKGGADNLFGDAGADKLYGGDGDDYLDGGQDDDTLSGGSGNNFYALKVGSGRDVVERSYTDFLAAVDTVLVPSTVGVANVDVIREANDIIFQIKGTQDSIRFKGVMYNDGLYSGYSFQYGVAGDTAVSLSAFKDALLHGGINNDTLQGYATDDNITGGAGNDVLYGNAGNDTLEGGLGSDSLTGGSDNNTYVYNKGDGTDHIYSTYDSSAGKVSTLQFKSGVSSLNDIVLGGSADGSLIINISGSATDQITVHDFLASDNVANYSNPIQQIKFGDGTTRDLTAILSKLFAGTANADLLYGTVNADTITGQGGADSLYGQGGNDNLVGGAGDDKLYGGEGADTLDGGLGNDTLSGGAGLYRGDWNNTYLFGKLDGQDYITAKDIWITDHLNTLQFKSGVAPGEVAMVRSDDNLVFSIANTSDQITVEKFFYGDNPSGIDNPIQQVAFTGNSTIWNLSDIKNFFLIGNNTDQSLRGYVSADSISAAGGADTIKGLAGNDTLDGGAGNDFIYGGNDQDDIQGGADNDRVYGEDGDDIIDGGSGNDTLNGGLGNDTFKFGRLDGQDYISDSEDLATNKLNTLLFKNDVAYGDVVVSRAANDLILSIVNTTSRVTIESYFYNNDPANNLNPVQQIKFADGTTWSTNTIQQFLSGYVGGASTPDLLQGQGGADSLNGGSGNDTLYGGAGNDTLHGDDDNDVIYGDADQDRLYGGDGDDTLDGGAGNDTFNGGLGNDTYIYGKGDGQDYISDSDDDAPVLRNTLQFKSNLAARDIAATLVDADLKLSTPTITDRLTIESFYAANDPTNTFNPVQQFSFADGSLWNLSAISQFIAAVLKNGTGSVNGTATADKLYTLAGNDTLFGLAGADFLFAGQGQDSLDGGADNDWLYGEDGDDTLVGAQGADNMIGGAGNDTYRIDNPADIVIEQATPDDPLNDDIVETSVSYTAPLNIEDLMATGTGNINLTSNDDGCYLTGNVGNNYLKGGAALDFIFGDEGVDTLEGGSGDDYYYLTDNLDTVIEQAGGGLDQIWAFGNGIKMADNVERLYMKSFLAISAYGNEGKNYMMGNNRNNTLYGYGGADQLFGLSGNDVFYGGLGNDTLYGATGNDTYHLQRGDGADTIVDTDGTAGNQDTLDLDNAINANQVWFARSGSNLVVSVIGTTDSVTITNWFVGATYQIESFAAAGNGKTLSKSKVQVLVDAMAAFTPPAAGQTTLPANYQTALNGVIASSWV